MENANQTTLVVRVALPNDCRGTGFTDSYLKSGYNHLAGRTSQDARFLTSKRDGGDDRVYQIGLVRPFFVLDVDFAISSGRTKLQRGSRFLSGSRSLGRIL